MGRNNMQCCLLETVWPLQSRSHTCRNPAQDWSHSTMDGEKFMSPTTSWEVIGSYRLLGVRGHFLQWCSHQLAVYFLGSNCTPMIMVATPIKLCKLKGKSFKKKTRTDLLQRIKGYERVKGDKMVIDRK